MDSKPWYTSKTNLIAILKFVIGLLALLAGSDFIKEHPQLVAIFIQVSALLDFWLRQITDTPTTSVLPAARLWVWFLISAAICTSYHYI